MTLVIAKCLLLLIREDIIMNKLNGEKWETINEIVAYIYAADPYPDFNILIEKMEDLLEFSNSLSCMASDVSEKVTFFDFRSPSIPKQHIADYCSHFIHYDFIQWFSAAPIPVVCRATDIIVKRYMETSIFMRQWLEPINVYYGLLVNVAANDHLYANIVFYRSKEEGDFSDEDIEVVSILNRHLCACFGNKYPKGIYHNPNDNNTQEFQNKYGLSDKESQIIQLICSGTPRKELSGALYISNNTLKNYLSNIYKKIGVSSYGELINSLLPHFDLSANIKNVNTKKDNA